MKFLDQLQWKCLWLQTVVESGTTPINTLNCVNVWKIWNILNLLLLCKYVLLEKVCVLEFTVLWKKLKYVYMLHKLPFSLLRWKIIIYKRKRTCYLCLHSLVKNLAKFMRILEQVKTSNCVSDLLLNSPKSSPRFSPGCEGTEKIFYFVTEQQTKPLIVCNPSKVSCTVHITTWPLC